MAYTLICGYRLLSTGVFSDIELHLPTSRIIKAHSFILLSQSTWLAGYLTGKTSVGLTALDDPSLQHFGFEGYGAETHAQNLTAIITFCYTGSYGLPDLLEHDNASEKIQQAYFLLLLYVHFLARQYGIPSLVEHSFEKMKTMADTLREMHSRVHLAVFQRLVDFSGFNKGVSMVPFPLEQIQLVILDGAA
ncbi:hypothetical protein E8E11_002241 [Didymella keratinophila]|nr:hypothetical protein E8E11_002241 [Didymella keratinophila]